MSDRPALPHAEAIREVRARVMACEEAQLLHQHLKTAYAALSILENQVALGTPLLGEMAGEDAVAKAIATYPSLAELGALFPSGASDASRLRARRQQLDLIEQTIRPRLDEREEAAHTLHELQHAQVHELEKPEWASVVAELRILGEERDQTSLAMAPLQNELSALSPILEMIRGFQPTLQAELIQATRTDDPHGALAWRVALMARQQLVGLAGVIEQLGVQVVYPFEPMLPDDPHPRHRRRLRKEAGDVLVWMADLAGQLDHRAERLEMEIDRLRERHDAAEAALMAWMG